jgi:transmembrane sensor
MEQDQIEQLMVKRLAGMTTASENACLDELLAGDPAVQAQWDEICTMAGSKDMQAFAESLDVESAWDELQTIVAPARPSRIITLRRFSAAAAIIVLLGGATYFLITRQSPADKVAVDKKAAAMPIVNGIRLQTADGDVLALSGEHAAKTATVNGTQLSNKNETLSFESNGSAVTNWNTLIVPAKLDYKVVLADGSQVWLNANSQLRFPFSFPGDNREVFIEGEAYFKIVPDAGKPFIVNIGESRVEVLGTEFNINNYDSKAITASLVKGAIAVNNKTERVVLAPGREAVYNEAGKVKVQAFDEDHATSWMNGIYTFRNTPLSVMVEVVPRMFDVKVVFDNEEAANIRFTGAMSKHEELSYFLRNLDLAADIKSYYKDGVLHLK